MIGSEKTFIRHFKIQTNSNTPNLIDYFTAIRAYFNHNYIFFENYKPKIDYSSPLCNQIDPQLSMDPLEKGQKGKKMLEKIKREGKKTQ